MQEKLWSHSHPRLMGVDPRPTLSTFQGRLRTDCAGGVSPRPGARVAEVPYPRPYAFSAKKSMEVSNSVSEARLV